VRACTARPPCLPAGASCPLPARPIGKSLALALAIAGHRQDFLDAAADAGGEALDFGAHVVDGLGFGIFDGFVDDFTRGVQIGEAGAGDDFAKGFDE